MLNFSSSLFSAAVRTLLALLLLAGSRLAAAQAPVWQSAQTVAVATGVAAGNNSVVNATAVDAAGNVYLVGKFTNTVVLGNTTLTSLGSNDVFVAKFNPVSNQFVWALRAGGSDSETATAVAVSGASVYVAGTFQGSTAGFGSTILTSTGEGDVFVAKLTDAGNVVWAQQAGGTGSDGASTIAVSGTSVYVAGSFDSLTANFGATTLTRVGNTTAIYIYDVFVAKLTDTGSMGSFVWAQRAGGADIDYATALAVSGNSVYLAGYFYSLTAGFGPIMLTCAGLADIFVAKLTDMGSTSSFAWAQRAGGSQLEEASSLAVSGTSVYVAGNFDSAGLVFGSTTLVGSFYSQAYVAKLTDAGSTSSFVWAQQTVEAANGNGSGTVLAVNGNSVYVAGSFNNSTASFGGITLTNVGSPDIFVAKLIDSGSTSSFTWVQQASNRGNYSNHVNELAVSGNSVHVVGNLYNATTDFGPLSVTVPNFLPPTPGPSLCVGYLATLTDPTLTATALPRAAPPALYPNPAHHTATLRLPVGTAPAPLILCDAQGRAVRRYPAPATLETTLDLQNLPAGLYLLRGAGPAQRLVVE